MKRHHRRYWAALTGAGDAVPQSVAEVRALQRRAWEDEGLLIVSPDDERLSDEDRCDLHRIAERLFRERRACRLTARR